MNKIKVTNEFYGMGTVYFNNIVVTTENIDQFKLYTIYSSDVAAIYVTKWRSRIKILHVKDIRYGNYLSYVKGVNPVKDTYVDWFEVSIKDTIQAIEQYRSVTHFHKNIQPILNFFRITNPLLNNDHG